MSQTSDSTEWVVAECDESQVSRLASEAGLSPIIARLLVLRGIATPSHAEAFFNPSLDHLHDPGLLPDVDAGARRVARAIRAGEKICVHGDYDVDGVTSAALLVRTLRDLGADVEYRLPHRRKEGYDIKPAYVAEAADKGAKLIITCDCGISAHETVKLAGKFGIDVIITDHHECGSRLPKATAVINPKRADCQYPFKELAGVGVALKFAQGVVRELGYNHLSFLEKFLDLTALGTVGDVMPLLGENRAIVRYGLDAIPQSKKVGLRAMLRSTGLDNRQLTSYSLGFVLGPRINAIGRMDDAALALKLLLTKDEAEAAELAAAMEQFNTDRRAEQERVLEQALMQVETKDLDAMRVLVLAENGWNTGVVGIVAGKIRELFNRPAILICKDEESGTGGGSARSIPCFNMIEALRSCDDLLTSYGGHAQAAGVGLELKNLQPFEQRINELAADLIPEEALAPRIEVEAELGPEHISRQLLDAIASMEPFGTGNPEPVFMTRGFGLVSMQRVGDGSHLKLQVGGNGSGPIDCIAFRMGDAADSLQLGGNVDMCYSIRLNEFNGNESVQLVVSAIRPS